jgi:hypothetical protein
MNDAGGDKSSIKISWDDLKSQQVDDRLRAQEQIGSTKSHYEHANVVAPTMKTSRWAAIAHNAIAYLTAFGLLGALLGWGAGEALSLRPAAADEARQLINDYESIARAEKTGRYSAAEAKRVRDAFVRRHAENPYFAAHIDPSLSQEDRERQTVQAMEKDRQGEFVADLMFFAVSGLFIAIALASADRLVDRNFSGATVNAAIGAVAGLLGGAVVALLSRTITNAIVGPADEAVDGRMLMFAGAVKWSLLGAIIAAAPGLALRSSKRTLIGVAGGLVGGLLGGLMFAPIEAVTGSAMIGRLVGLLAIGGCAGAASGFIESVAKQGWLRVVEGLIAGKQFILYRNPTFIGSAAMSHIYLFRDPQVGRRHAAIYQTPAGFEIENLPLGSPTFVNDRPVTRVRLREGDRVRCGRTVFVFQEKTASRS